MNIVEAIQLFKKGDPRSFDYFYNRYKVDLIYHANERVGADFGEDIVHDAFIKLWLDRRKIKEIHPGTIKTFARQLVNWGCYDFLKKKRVNKTHGEQWMKIFCEDVDPFPSRSDYLENYEHKVKPAVDRLNKKMRDTVFMYFFEEMKQKEIESSLGIPLITIHRYLKQGKQLIRQILETGRCQLPAEKPSCITAQNN